MPFNLTRIYVSAAALLLSVTLPAYAEIQPRQVLDTVYKGGYDKARQCWRAFDKENSQAYCMKLDLTRLVNTQSGPRLYLLVSGTAVDEKGEPNGAHVTSGMVGAFAVEERDGRAEIIAADALLPVGASGAAPTGWKLVQFGPNDYWGWLNEAGDCHQGYCGTRTALLAPYGRQIKDLAGFAKSYSNGGACGDDACFRKSTELESAMQIDNSVTDTKVYPLTVTVKGTNKGRKIAPKRFTLVFDAKKWSYQMPSDWPLKDADF